MRTPDWADEDPLLFGFVVTLVVVLAVLVSTLAFGLLGHPSPEQVCLNSGGYWHITGSHMGFVGKVYQRITDYGCASAP